MFTGLIESVGTVLESKSTTGASRLVVSAPQLAGRWRQGDSIAVNGVCLTAIDHELPDDPHPGRFCADLADETARRTTLALLQAGDLVNLELPTPSGSPLGGHVVQGHVDGTGTLISLIPLHPNDLDATDWRMTIEIPPEMAPNVVSQGSITVDGISLTIAKVDGLRLEIAIIPHTYKSTNLRALLAGSPVNLEADVLSKYASQRATSTPTPTPFIPTPDATQLPEITPTNEWLTPEYLLENGY
jgi:riboflavin synthase